MQISFKSAKDGFKKVHEFQLDLAEYLNARKEGSKFAVIAQESNVKFEKIGTSPSNPIQLWADISVGTLDTVQARPAAKTEKVGNDMNALIAQMQGIEASAISIADYGQELDDFNPDFSQTIEMGAEDSFRLGGMPKGSVQRRTIAIEDVDSNFDQVM